MQSIVSAHLFTPPEKHDQEKNKLNAQIFVVELKTLFFGHCCFNIFFVLSIFFINYVFLQERRRAKMGEGVNYRIK